MQSDLDGQEEDEDIELKSIFYVGQYLRASVVSTNDEPMKKADEKGKRRIELSLRPQEANIGYYHERADSSFDGNGFGNQCRGSWPYYGPWAIRLWGAWVHVFQGDRS